VDRRAALLVLVLVLVLGAVPAGASAATWYTVEVVVFALLSPDASAEIWPAEPGRPPLDGSIELGSDLTLSDDGTPFAFRRLGTDRLMLQEAAARLRRSSLYRPLLHVGWRQPGFEPGEARAVHVTAADGGATGSIVDGTVRVWRERFLHVEVDLVYGLTLEAAPAPVVGGAGFAVAPAPSRAYFRLHERRRMRSRELHFLDHPMFGVLVTAAPFEVDSTPSDPPPAEVPAAAPPAVPDRAPPPGPAAGSEARSR